MEFVSEKALVGESATHTPTGLQRDGKKLYEILQENRAKEEEEEENKIKRAFRMRLLTSSLFSLQLSCLSLFEQNRRRWSMRRSAPF